MLEVNHLLCIFKVGLQLYGQLKESLHEGTGALDSTAISMASQATRLGKGSSIMVWDKHMPLRSYYGESILE